MKNTRRKENIAAVRELLVSRSDADVLFWATFISTLGDVAHLKKPEITNRADAIELFAGWRDSARRAVGD